MDAVEMDGYVQPRDVVWVERPKKGKDLAMYSLSYDMATGFSLSRDLFMVCFMSFLLFCVWLLPVDSDSQFATDTPDVVYHVPGNIFSLQLNFILMPVLSHTLYSSAIFKGIEFFL